MEGGAVAAAAGAAGVVVGAALAGAGVFAGAGLFAAAGGAAAADSGLGIGFPASPATTATSRSRINWSLMFLTNISRVCANIWLILACSPGLRPSN